MKAAVTIRHVMFEDLGHLTPLLEERGYRIDYREAGIDPLGDAAEADLLVVLGGPIGANDDDDYPFIAEQLRLLEARLADRRPTLGICLGAQLMARALGAEVVPMAAGEIGFAPLRLTPAGHDSALAALPENLPVLHWHGDRFAIPDNAEHLAGSQHCDNQAFTAGSHALALQFHLECDLERIEQWLIGHTGELSRQGISPVALREQARELAGPLGQAGEQVFSRWLDNLPAAW